MKPYSLTQIRKPEALAIPLEEVKLFLKIDNDIEDELITSLINAVTSKCERYTAKALISQQWKVSYRYGMDELITLPITPVMHIDEVRLYNFNHESIVLNKSLYQLDDDEISFLALPFSYKLTVIYTAGFGKSHTYIPAELKAIMLEHVAYLYENRGSTTNFPITKYYDYKTFRL